MSSETGKLHILLGKKSFLGFNTKVSAVLAKGDMSGLTLQGKILIGKRKSSIWQALDK